MRGPVSSLTRPYHYATHRIRYARWDDARKQWGSIINNCRSLVRQANTFFREDRYPGYGNFRDYRRRVAAETSAFTRCLRCFLRGKSDEPNLQATRPPHSLAQPASFIATYARSGCRGPDPA